MITRDKFMSILACHFWRWLWRFVAVVLVLAAMRSAIADWSEVPTRSMAPTILAGDRIYVNKIAYDLKVPFTTVHFMTWSDPQRGDVVVFFSPRDGMPLLKRIAAVPGDHVEGRNEAIPQGKYYVLGDNPSQSLDSREFGLVDRKQIVGRAVEVMVSLDPDHFALPRWSRFFTSLEARSLL
jgi:signal peptidase I